jgi:hypothetical protein
MSSKKGGGLPGMGLVEKLVVDSHETGGLHISARPLIITMAVLVIIFFFFSPAQTLRNFNLVIFLAPVWVPVMLSYFAFQRFFQSRRAAFIKDQQAVLLELRLPRDTKKTPLAMETVFTNLNFSAGETTWYKKYWKGGARPWWSIEMASIGGQVRFYLWTRASLRRGVESYFYAQYPGMEIIEAEDYSRIIDPSDTGERGMFGAEYVHTNDDPFPIQTYIEFGLDKPGTKPEEQIDPLSQLVEFLGSIGPNEQLWFQIIFRKTGKEKLGDRTWQDQGNEIIEQIRKETISKRTQVDPVTGAVRETEGFPNPTPGQKATIEALGRNTSKPGFDVGMRCIYTAKNGSFDASNITFLINMLKPFSSEGWNGFKLAGLFSARFNDYPWEDRGGHHKQHEHEKIVEFYRRRAYFHDPYVGPWMIMSSEELATVFHVPSSTIDSPSLPRIQSATGGAPANLPT